MSTATIETNQLQVGDRVIVRNNTYGKAGKEAVVEQVQENGWYATTEGVYSAKWLEQLAHSSQAAYTPQFLTPDEADRLYQFSQGLDWQQNQMAMYGKTMPLPRLEIMFGDAGCTYRYGSVTLTPHPWTPELLALKEQVEAATGCTYQVVIGNLYRSGNDHIGWHSDDSPEMGTNPAIASISLGVTRTFQTKNQANEIQSFELGNGDLLFMPPGFQETHKHRLCKQPKISGVRINWTFRPHQGTVVALPDKKPDSPFAESYETEARAIAALFRVGDRVTHSSIPGVGVIKRRLRQGRVRVEFPGIDGNTITSDLPSHVLTRAEDLDEQKVEESAIAFENLKNSVFVTVDPFIFGRFQEFLITNPHKLKTIENSDRKVWRLWHSKEYLDFAQYDAIIAIASHHDGSCGYGGSCMGKGKVEKLIKAILKAGAKKTVAAIAPSAIIETPAKSITNSPLDSLVNEINTLYGNLEEAEEVANSAARSALQFARDMGDRLLQLKEQAGHGNWEEVRGQIKSPRTGKELPSSTATLYQRIAKRWAELDQTQTLTIRDAAETLKSDRQALPKSAAEPKTVADLIESDENYTGKTLIESVTRVLRRIDFDPFSCEEANKTVKAKVFYDRNSNGLIQPWAIAGQTQVTVWDNCPYSMPLVQQASDRHIQEWQSGTIEASIAIRNNATDTKWFQALSAACTVRLDLRGREQFHNPYKDYSGGNRQGQVLFYFGSEPERFYAEFEGRGLFFPPPPAISFQSQADQEVGDRPPVCKPSITPTEFNAEIRKPIFSGCHICSHRVLFGNGSTYKCSLGEFDGLLLLKENWFEKNQGCKSFSQPQITPATQLDSEVKLDLLLSESRLRKLEAIAAKHDGSILQAIYGLIDSFNE